MQWLDDVFGVHKPVIAMLHLDALPGDPSFDTAAGMRAVVDNARRDLEAQQSMRVRDHANQHDYSGGRTSPSPRLPADCGNPSASSTQRNRVLV